MTKRRQVRRPLKRLSRRVFLHPPAYGQLLFVHVGSYGVCGRGALDVAGQLEFLLWQPWDEYDEHTDGANHHPRVILMHPATRSNLPRSMMFSAAWRAVLPLHFLLGLLAVVLLVIGTYSSPVLVAFGPLYGADAAAWRRLVFCYPCFCNLGCAPGYPRLSRKDLRRPES